jgi:hypothetical protein
VGDIDFKVISTAENSNNKFQKPRFWKEKSVQNVVTLEGFMNHPRLQGMLSFR